MFVTFPHTLTRAEHKKTPALVSFRGQHPFYTHPPTPNTKETLSRCLFVVGVFPTPTHSHRTQRDTFNGVCSCSASFLHPLMHAKHKETPSLVSVRARCLSYTLIMLSAFPTSLMHAEHENTPAIGVSLCSALSLARRADCKGDCRFG